MDSEARKAKARMQKAEWRRKLREAKAAKVEENIVEDDVGKMD
jgi:hypothetical protein